jgi:hypothetical protein
MITASEFVSSPTLAPFIRSYTYREFDTRGTDVIKPWQTSHDTINIFFFKYLVASLTDLKTGTVLKRGKDCLLELTIVPETAACASRMLKWLTILNNKI